MRFAFAGTNLRVDEGQSQLCAQTERQRSLLREKYSIDKLYVVVEDVASISSLDVSAARGTLVAVIKQQDPMGDTARWYVDNGITQGFLPSQKLRPAQRSSQQPDRTVKDVPVEKNSSPPPLMSLDSPEKEVKKLAQSHLQDLLSLDYNQEAMKAINHNYSNIPETKARVYQNINTDVSVFLKHAIYICNILNMFEYFRFIYIYIHIYFF